MTPPSQDEWKEMNKRVEEIRLRHGDGVRQWWPTYREDPNWGPTPDDLTEADALDAVMEALNSEGVDAWSGDATSIVAQMLYQQYTKRKDAERRAETLEGAFRGRGFHAPGMERCQHGTSRWVGSHCSFDEPALAAEEKP